MSSSEYKIIEQPLHSGRKIRVVCVGAGASGLLLAYKINHNFYESDVTVQIYEKNADLGGTWLENRYLHVYADL
jgi:cation diffusion facilitator CzcD-associated flavoprotein CzcO